MHEHDVCKADVDGCCAIFSPKQFLHVVQARGYLHIGRNQFRTWACASNSWIYFWMRAKCRMEIENLFHLIQHSGRCTYICHNLFVAMRWVWYMCIVCNETHSPTFLNGICEQCANQPMPIIIYFIFKTKVIECTEVSAIQYSRSHSSQFQDEFRIIYLQVG